MYIQDVVALDKSASRYMDARRVDLHQRRGLHQFPRLALEAVLTPLPAACRCAAQPGLACPAKGRRNKPLAHSNKKAPREREPLRCEALAQALGVPHTD